MYKLEVQLTASYRELDCNMSDVKVVESYEGDYIFTRKNVDGQLKFTGSAYNILKAKLDAGIIELPAIIYRADDIMVEGMLNLFGEINDTTKEMSCSFRVIDDYTEILQNLDAEIKLNFYHELQLFTNSITKITSFITDSALGTPAENNYQWFSTVNNGDGTWTHTYKKQVIPFYYPGWTRDTSFGFFGFNHPFPTFENMWSYPAWNPVQINKSLEYFTTLTNILSRLESKAGFNFNSSSFASYLIEDYQNIYFGDIARIKDPEADGSNITITLQTVLDAMKHLFNLDWKLVSGYLVFVHPSERLFIAGGVEAHILTNVKPWARGMGVSYDSEIPANETWKMKLTERQDYDGLPITYPSNGKAISYSLTEFTANLPAALDPSDELKDGILIVTAADNDRISFYPGIIEGIELPNGRMAISRLHNDFHKQGRRFVTGNMNGANETFTAEPFRRLESIKVPYKLSDFNFDNLVETEFTQMRISKVAEPLNGGFTDLDLIY
jgi:hypothetical protein